MNPIMNFCVNGKYYAIRFLGTTQWLVGMKDIRPTYQENHHALM